MKENPKSALARWAVTEFGEPRGWVVPLGLGCRPPQCHNSGQRRLIKEIERMKEHVGKDDPPWRKPPGSTGDVEGTSMAQFRRKMRSR